MSGGCTLCPRRCGADRSNGAGRCGAGEETVVARAALHMWEEPCISGDRGSGAVFFSGCTLGCVYCQNRAISRGGVGRTVSEDRLARIFLELEAKGACNINLVTPDHYAFAIARAMRTARAEGLSVPVAANTGGYLSEEAFSALSGVTDIWLTDYKYCSRELAERYSGAADYPEVADRALALMAEAAREPKYDPDGMMTSGVIVRHLMLPGCLRDSKDVVSRVYWEYGDRVVMSLMNQYTPPAEDMPEFPELMRAVSAEEYGELVDYALGIGVENAYIQEGGTVSESFIPPFDCEGV